MKLRIVGCSGSVSGPESPASCYLIQAPYEGRTFSLLLDCGPGALGALYRYLDPAQIDAIGLSHLHPDHCLDLCGYYVAARYSDPSTPWPARPLYGPTGTAERLARAYDVPSRDGGTAESGVPITQQFAYRDWEAEQTIGPFTVRTAQVAHPVEAYAIRVEENIRGGGALVYSGDTGPTEALTTLAANADLLLVESAFMGDRVNPPDLHLTGRQAAEIGERAEVGRILLTHIPPWHDREAVLTEATPHFSGSISLAVAGADWTIG